MDRRWAGIGVLVVALLAVAVLPKLDGRGIAGTAVRGPTPVVGNCLNVASLDVPYAATNPIDGRQLPTGVVGPCSSENAGMLIAVAYDRRVPTATKPDAAAGSGVTDRSAYDVEQNRLCESDPKLLLDAIGDRDQVVWTGEGGQQVGYLAARGQLDGVLVASPAGADRKWIGCVLATFDNTGTKPFSQTSARAADQLAACDSGKLKNYQPAFCGQPHTSEVLGTAYMKMGAATRSDFEQACRAYAVHRIGSDGPVASGKIRIEVDDGGNWPGGDCRVSVVDPARTLSGTVVGIGDGPLPWTP